MSSNKAPAGATSSHAPDSFESAISELESLVQSLEGGKLSLEAALEGYQRGTELIRYCQQTLGQAEQKIQVLEAGLLQDFPPQPSAQDPADGAE